MEVKAGFLYRSGERGVLDLVKHLLDG